MSCHENTKNWDLVLPQGEFSYNSSINRRTGMSLFKIVTRYDPNRLFDLIPLHVEKRPSEHASSFAEHIRDLHYEI